MSDNLVVTTQVISTSLTASTVNEGLTAFKISYPEKWAKPKFHKDGEVINVSKETAKQFEDAGIGSIVTTESETKVEQSVETKTKKK